MLRVIMTEKGRTELHVGGTIAVEVSANGDLLLSRLQKSSKLTAQGMMDGFEKAPIKIYARGTWREVEYIEEPGDGLTLTQQPAAVDSQA